MKSPLWVKISNLARNFFESKVLGCGDPVSQHCASRSSIGRSSEKKEKYPWRAIALVDARGSDMMSLLARSLVANHTTIGSIRRKKPF